MLGCTSIIVAGDKLSRINMSYNLADSSWRIVNIIDRLRDTKEFDNLIVTSYLKDGFGYSRYVALILWQCLSRCTVLVLISRLIITSRTAICRPNRLILITYMIKIVCSY